MRRLGGGVEYVTPNVSVCVKENELHYNPYVYDPILKFTAEEANSTIKLNRMGSATTLANAVLQYSTDNGETWNDYVYTQQGTIGYSGDTITLENVGDSVKFKGTNATLGVNGSNYHKFVTTGKIKATGDVTSLFNEVGGDFAMPSYGCYYMFNGCKSLTAAPELPATTLGNHCYYGMFQNCTSLTASPELPATTLAGYCYTYMFYDCTSLTTAPALPATTLAGYCYSYMFENCTSLTDTPELPATTLASYCYHQMFRSCTSLTTAPKLPATTLANNCYRYMFYLCTSLTAAPELPATTLANNCYSYMFQGCSNLSYIKALFTTTPSTTYTNNWVNGVASKGTFVKNSAATWNVTGVNGIPNDWTVQTASE